MAFHEFGGPEVLNPVEVPDPEPGPGQVRIRVVAATVNPTDTLFRSGRRPFDPALEPPPWIPGQELAGYVEGLGPDVRDWRAGERVAAVTRPAPGIRGAQAELALVWSDSITRVPSGVSLVHAATLPMNGLAALQAIDLSGAQAGGTVLVTGAAGAVGGYAVQIARSRGIRTIATASARDQDLIRALGADEFIDRDRDVVMEVRRLAAPGVDALVDAALVGGSLIGAVGDGGRYIGLRGTQGATSERGIVAAGVAVANSLRDGRKLASLIRLVEEGALTLRVAQTFPPEAAAEAHRMLERGGHRGRLVLQFAAER